MRIDNVTNYSSTNFKSLTVSYNAEHLLDTLSKDVLAKILDVGKIVEKTDYVDLQLLSDLSFRIKEKGNLFSGIKEPINAVKPQQNENFVIIKGVYDGVENKKLKRGKNVQHKIQYRSYAEALKGYNLIYNARNKVERLGVITKEIDRQKMYDAELERIRANGKPKISLQELIISRYGNFVREFEG